MSTDADAPESAPGFWERFLDNSWLERRHEHVLEPDLPIVDPHHHIWEKPMPDYPVSSLLSDLHAGRRVVATVYLESPRALSHRRSRAAAPGRGNRIYCKPCGATRAVTGYARSGCRHDRPRRTD